MLFRSNQSLEKQAALVTKGFKLDKVNDKTYIDNFLKRFVAARDRQAAQENASADFNSGNMALSLFSGGRLNIYV